MTFDKIFSFQLENHYSSGDLVILLSCSGSSQISLILSIIVKKRFTQLALDLQKNIQKKANIN